MCFKSFGPMPIPSGFILRATLGCLGSGFQLPLKLCRKILSFLPRKKIPCAIWSRNFSSPLRLVASASRLTSFAVKFSMLMSWRIIARQSFALGDLTATRPCLGPSRRSIYVTSDNSRSNRVHSKHTAPMPSSISAGNSLITGKTCMLLPEIKAQLNPLPRLALRHNLSQQVNDDSVSSLTLGDSVDD